VICSNKQGKSPATFFIDEIDAVEVEPGKVICQVEMMKKNTLNQLLLRWMVLGPINVIVLLLPIELTFDKALMRAVVLIDKFLLTYQTLEKELKSLKCTLRLLKK
jgi:hypothetical protein